jgi:hypothetical protein
MPPGKGCTVLQARQVGNAATGRLAWPPVTVIGLVKLAAEGPFISKYVKANSTGQKGNNQPTSQTLALPVSQRAQWPAGKFPVPIELIVPVGSAVHAGLCGWPWLGRIAALVTASFSPFTWALPPGSIRRRTGRYCGAPARPSLAAAPGVRTGGRR